ncbi:hypothetical protein KXJ74_15795 [Acinetobacter johnsonii]|nr:hypothetical protein KXJ74_15795 [Acinetobacter johnsonii]
MEKLEVFLINLFMLGENFSTYNNQRVRDTTTIQCECFKFEFKQLNIKQKQKDFVNQSIITTKITIENISSDQIEQILGIIDDFCWLLSFIQQSPVCRHGYKINSNESWTSCLGVIANPLNNIIESYGKEIRNFIEQVYPTFKKIKSARQLTVIFGYLCEANRASLALEISLISHYVAIENLKNTFALDNNYEYLGQNFTHKNFPHLDSAPLDIENYWPPKGKRKKYIHKTYGQISSTEMTLRMFEANNFQRAEIMPFLNKRHTIIHEGILLPFGDINYSKQAIEDLRDVSDLLRQYLLTLINYQGSYYLSRDRIGPSGLIT